MVLGFNSLSINGIKLQEVMLNFENKKDRASGGVAMYEATKLVLSEQLIMHTVNPNL